MEHALTGTWRPSTVASQPGAYASWGRASRAALRARPGRGPARAAYDVTRACPRVGRCRDRPRCSDLRQTRRWGARSPPVRGVNCGLMAGAQRLSGTGSLYYGGHNHRSRLSAPTRSTRASARRRPDGRRGDEAAERLGRRAGCRPRAASRPQPELVDLWQNQGDVGERRPHLRGMLGIDLAAPQAVEATRDRDVVAPGLLEVVAHRDHVPGGVLGASYRVSR